MSKLCKFVGDDNKNTYIMTLREWQTLWKNRDTLIVQASDMTGNSSLKIYPIGMSYKYVQSTPGDRCLQIGSHEKTVFCGISDSTDSRRRPKGVNRKTILTTLSANSIKNTLLGGKEYFLSLPTYKFVISPEGNGVDCHRHYEALLAGSIPIIEHNLLMENKYKGCPILYTTDYSEITEEYLIQTYNDMLDKTYDFSRLFLSYYSPDQIQSIKQCGNYWVKRFLGVNWY